MPRQAQCERHRELMATRSDAQSHLDRHGSCCVGDEDGAEHDEIWRVGVNQRMEEL